MTTIQQRFDELGEVIAGLRSRVFDLTNRLAKIVEHRDTPELIRQYARGQIGSQPVAPIDGTGWAEAAFDRYQSSGNIKPQASPGDWNYSKAQCAGIPITEFESHRDALLRCGYVLNDGMWTKGQDGLADDVDPSHRGGHVERGLAELRGQGE